MHPGILLAHRAHVEVWISTLGDTAQTDMYPSTRPHQTHADEHQPPQLG